MLVVISPAKRLDMEPMPGAAATTPEFLREAGILAGHARQQSLTQLKRLMGLSDELARLTRDRFCAYRSDPAEDTTKPAVFAFAGDTYLGLDAASLEPDALDFATRHLRILSGLYGVLRPLDAIQPYRLEMGSRLRNRRGMTLYDFWGDLPTRALNQAAREAGAQALVNCASQEYFGAVLAAKLDVPVITPSFHEETGGAPRMVSFHAKKARGAMARFVIERRVADPDGLLEFDYGGYRHDKGLSTPDRPAFLRPMPEPA